MNIIKSRVTLVASQSNYFKLRRQTQPVIVLDTYLLIPAFNKLDFSISSFQDKFEIWTQISLNINFLQVPFAIKCLYSMVGLPSPVVNPTSRFSIAHCSLVNNERKNQHPRDIKTQFLTPLHFRFGYATEPEVEMVIRWEQHESLFSFEFHKIIN